MTQPIRKPRRYDSTRRREGARQTRLQIAAAARELFLERGYAGATIEAIATRAGVAKETVYATFKNKRNILAFLLNISLGGDDQPVRILDRPEPQAVLRDNDPRRQIAGFARGMAEIMQRAAPVFAVMRSAAKTEPEIADHVGRLLAERLENMRFFVQHVAANGGLRPGMEVEQAGEIVWTLSSPEVYQLLTGDLDWPAEKYSQWLAESLTRLLLA